MIESAREEILDRLMSEFHLNKERLREAIEYLKGWILLELIEPQVICTFGQDCEHD